MWQFNILILLWHLYITVDFTLTDLVTLVYKGTLWWWCLCMKTYRIGKRRRKVLASNIVNLLVNKRRIYKTTRYTQFPTSTNVLYFPHLAVSSLTFSMLTVPVTTIVSIFEPYKWFHLGLWNWQHWKLSLFLCLHNVSTPKLSPKVSKPVYLQEHFQLGPKWP